MGEQLARIIVRPLKMKVLYLSIRYVYIISSEVLRTPRSYLKIGTR